MKKDTIFKVIGIIVAIAAVVGACYALYRYLAPKLEKKALDDFEDAFGDDESDIFEDDDL